MMFLEESPESNYETITYNDFEYLDDYESYNGLFVRYVNSGLPTLANMSFDKLLRMPNHLADWAIDWATKQTLQSTTDNNAALNKLDQEMARAQQQAQASSLSGKKDPFNAKY